MITNQNEISKYLTDYKDGKIKMGLDTGILDLDNAIRFKYGQVNIINGLDNVGKTAFILWYFLVLSHRHNLKWCIWSGENKAGQLVRQMIEFYTGKKLKDLTIAQIYEYELKIKEWFTFVDNSKMYKTEELFKLFTESGCNGALIDPYTGMNREYTHKANYDFLNQTRQFCNQTGITVYVNTHPVTEAARKVYSDKHEFSGYQLPPSKSDTEGGQPFANRPDDFMTIHRLLGHPVMKYKTLLFIRKVKDTETGGSVTAIDQPIEFDFNSGLGFTCNGQNPLNVSIKNAMDFQPLDFNNNFDNEEAPF